MAKLWNIYMLSINNFDTICFIPVISLFVVLIAIIMSSHMNVLIHGEKNIKYKIKYTGQGLCACKLVLITYVQSHCKGIFILR